MTNRLTVVSPRPSRPNLYFYVNELRRQADHLSWAYAELLKVVKSNDHQRILFFAQSMLTAAAQISKLFWPPTMRGVSDERRVWAEARGHQLREWGLPDEMLASRSVRNGLEHFDERLDSIYFEDPAVLVAPPFALGSSPGWMVPEMPQLRYLHVDPPRLTFSVLNEGVDLNRLAKIVEEVDLRLEAIDGHDLYQSEAVIAGLESA